MRTASIALGFATVFGTCACDDQHVVGEHSTVWNGGTSSARGGTSSRSQTPASGGTAFENTQTTILDVAGGTGNHNLQGTTVPSPSTGGTGNNMQPLDETCTHAPTQFEFSLDDPTAYCETSGSSTVQVQILDASGMQVSYLTSFESAVSPLRKRCPECAPKGAYTDLPVQRNATGFKGSWSGDREEIVYCETSTQPDLLRPQCGIRRCLVPGRFIARYCVAEKNPASPCSDGGSDPKNWLPRNVCLDVPFDFPSTDVVRGVIAQSLIPAGGAGQGGASTLGGNTSG